MKSVILVALILFYAGIVVKKKIKDMKAGKYCSCGCDSCPSKSGCHCMSEVKETEENSNLDL